MNKPRLQDIAQVAEIIAAVAVVISLLFVAFSINRNTAAIEAAEERAFLESWRNLTQLPFYTNAELAEIQLKVHSREELTPLEAQRWENFLRAVFDTWWQLHNSHANGLVSDQAWSDINGSILTLWGIDRMGDFWSERRRHYAGTPFGNHIDAEVARMSGDDNDE